MSLNDYLIACGLADERRPDKRTMALRERAVYELHGANAHLERLTPQRGAAFGKRAWLEALGMVAAAARMLATTYLPVTGLAKTKLSIIVADKQSPLFNDPLLQEFREGEVTDGQPIITAKTSGD